MEAKIAALVRYEVTLTKGGNFDKENKEHLATREITAYFGSL
jgi:hypothetical protein